MTDFLSVFMFRDEHIWERWLSPVVFRCSDARNQRKQQRQLIWLVCQSCYSICCRRMSRFQLKFLAKEMKDCGKWRQRTYSYLAKLWSLALFSPLWTPFRISFYPGSSSSRGTCCGRLPSSSRFSSTSSSSWSPFDSSHSRHGIIDTSLSPCWSSRLD